MRVEVKMFYFIVTILFCINYSMSQTIPPSLWEEKGREMNVTMGSNILKEEPTLPTDTRDRTGFHLYFYARPVIDCVLSPWWSEDYRSGGRFPWQKILAVQKKKKYLSLNKTNHPKKATKKKIKKKTNTQSKKR